MIVFGILGGPIERSAKLRIVRRQGWMQVIITAKLFLCRGTVGGLKKKNERWTFDVYLSKQFSLRAKLF